MKKFSRKANPSRRHGKPFAPLQTGCHRFPYKVMYTKRDAKAQAKNLNSYRQQDDRDPRRTNQIFRCDWCGSWHVGRPK